MHMLIAHHFIIIFVDAHVISRAEVHGHRIVTCVRHFNVENLETLNGGYLRTCQTAKGNVSAQQLKKFSK
jgi:hypothetical protein